MVKTQAVCLLLAIARTRVLMESDWYQRDFVGARISDRGNRALELATTAGGVRKAVSVGGSITGFGADLIIVDDYMEADEARSPTVRQELRNWFDNTLLSRLNDKATGLMISIQQRLLEDDLPAYMLEKGYSHHNLPAIAVREEEVATGQGVVHRRQVGDLLNPACESHDTLEQLRRDLGPVVFSAQYEQEPVTAEGNMLRLEWFGSYEVRPERHEFLKVVQSWDRCAPPIRGVSHHHDYGTQMEAAIAALHSDKGGKAEMRRRSSKIGERK